MDLGIITGGISGLALRRRSGDAGGQAEGGRFGEISPLLPLSSLKSQGGGDDKLNKLIFEDWVNFKYMKKLMLLVSWLAILSNSQCTQNVQSPEGARTDLCDGQVYQLISSDDPNLLINRDTYWLLDIRCDTQTMVIVKVLMGEKVSEREMPIKIAYSEGVITILDEAGNPASRLTNHDFPSETLFYEIPSEGLLVMDAQNYSLTFQKFTIQTQN
jgi:hypothetical protein